MSGRDRDKIGYVSDRTSSSSPEATETHAEETSDLSGKKMSPNRQNLSSQDSEKSAPTTVDKALSNAQEAAKPMPMQSDWLGRSLQQLYQETVEAPIPDSFKDLLDKLDLAEKKTNR